MAIESILSSSRLCILLQLFDAHSILAYLMSSL
uniref:Uncharacterized protein n=1 Tax=Rhizophora mucronata TaxID=61149 RepID=A0A2P2QKL1_RHIMU